MYLPFVWNFHFMERLHHVAVAVPDIGRALDWYRANLDVEVSYVDESWALLQFDNIAVALVLPEQHPRHLAVERENAKSFGALTPYRDGTASSGRHGIGLHQRSLGQCHRDSEGKIIGAKKCAVREL